MDHLAGSQMPAVDAAMLLFKSYGRRIILLIAVVGVISSATIRWPLGNWKPGS
jgi:hypothetical protein